jgi:hypothetical protein
VRRLETAEDPPRSNLVEEPEAILAVVELVLEERGEKAVFATIQDEAEEALIEVVAARLKQRIVKDDGAEAMPFEPVGYRDVRIDRPHAMLRVAFEGADVLHDGRGIASERRLRAVEEKEDSSLIRTRGHGLGVLHLYRLTRRGDLSLR